jgi:hypothetical protein
MKKNFLSLITLCLFTGTLLFSFSSNSNGKLSFFKQAHATKEVYITTYLLCPDQKHVYIVCAAGAQACTPTQCPE